MQQDLNKKNYLWCYVSLLKSARENYLIEYNADQTGYQFKNEITGIDKQLSIDLEFVKVCFY